MKKLFCTALLAASGCFALAQGAQSSPSRQRQLLDSMISTWERHGSFNGTLLIARKGEIVYQRSAGFADVEKGVPNSDRSPFNLASVSKPVTAVAVLQLVGKQQLGLKDAVTRYFPDFPYPGVTIEQLLSHTSGLPEADQYCKPYMRAHPAEILSDERVYEELVTWKPAPLAPPGTRHFYNNLNYILLAMLVEKASGEPFADYMRRHVFEPAGMKDTYVRGRLDANTARYFRPTFFDTAFVHVDSVTNRKIYTDFYLGGTQGDNNVVSTAGDLLLFDRALSGGKLLPGELQRLMYSPVKLANGENFYLGGRKTYTLGWNQNEKNAAGQYVVWHDGSLVGLTTILFRNLTDSVTYVVYENRVTPDFFRRFLAITQVIDGKQPLRVPLQQSLVRAYGATLVAEGVEAAAARLDQLQGDSAWYFHEHEMNELGYDLLLKSPDGRHRPLAVEVFKLNVRLFPKSANAYDSYGEALMRTGRKRKAVEMYRKSLQLNPGNEGAKRALAELGAR